MDQFCRLVTLAAGAAAGKFLSYEHKAPTVAAQTAYGIEVELEGFEEKYDGSTMLFMDFRRHHSGLWDGTAPRWESIGPPGRHVLRTANLGMLMEAVAHSRLASSASDHGKPRHGHRHDNKDAESTHHAVCSTRCTLGS